MTDCSKRCITSFLTSMNLTQTFYNSMDTFIVHTNYKSSIRLSRFLQSLITNKYIKCEIGLFYTEKYIFEGIYTSVFFLDNDNRNIFINNKSLLYGWINYKHLEIEICDFNTTYYIFEMINNEDRILKACNIFKRIEYVKTSVEKINVIMDTIKVVYTIIESKGSNDKIFPIFVYVLLQSKVRNLLLHHKFIDKYKRKVYKGCETGCSHLHNLQEEIACECYKTTRYEINEIDYYLVMFEAAIVFIERLEYSALTIDKPEYDKSFNDRIIDIEFERPIIKNSKKGSSMIKMIKKCVNYFK